MSFCGIILGEMRKAFTIIELMIVVAIISVLLTIAFRLTGTGEDQKARAETIMKMQHIENALSGYFAAFGSYPPVALHASRNVYTHVNKNGQQEEGQEDGELKWENVKAACEAQPFAARFPFSSPGSTSSSGTRNSRGDWDKATIDAAAQAAADLVRGGFWSDYPQLAGGLSKFNMPSEAQGKWGREKNWQNLKLFQFGVMSFLLPRYLFMTEGVDPDDLEDCAQWNANNKFAAHPNTGKSFDNWSNQLKDKRLVVRIPTQAVCARWMANFEGIVECNPKGDAVTMFGVRISGIGAGPALRPDLDVPVETFLRHVNLETLQVLDVMTVLDGWKNDFYYYSPPPFQSYRLWSSGPRQDGVYPTFPPWVPFDTLKSDADRKKAAEWMSDDIMFMSN